MAARNRQDHPHPLLKRTSKRRPSNPHLPSRLESKGNPKHRRTRLFVMTLGYSRKSVRLLVFRSSTQTWAELHEKAFRRLGGATRTVVLDNLREGVLKSDVYDPVINPLLGDVL